MYNIDQAPTHLLKTLKKMKTWNINKGHNLFFLDYCERKRSKLKSRNIKQYL